MQLEKVSPQILHFKCSTRKELTFTFGRVQEFYESPFQHIRRKRATLFDFINAYTSDDGKFSYFSDWSGFNFPDNVYRLWIKLHKSDLTPLEKIFVQQLKDSVTTRKFYVIGTFGENVALDHEIAHAMYYLNSGYAARAISIIEDFLDPDVFDQMCDALEKMGYDSSVFTDEINAYLSTSTPAFLKKRFKLTVKQVDPARRMLGQLFSKYNNMNEPPKDKK